MVLQQIVKVSSVSLVGFFVGLVTNNKNKDKSNNRKSRRMRPSRQTPKCRECQPQEEQEDDDVFGEEDQMHDNRREEKCQSVQKYEKSRQYVAQQTFKYQQVSQSQSPKKVTKTKKQVKKQQHQQQQRKFSRTVSAPVSGSLGGKNGVNPRDPLVDTLFHEIELLIKEKANMQGEIDNLRLEVQQLSELVTYLQMERDQESAEGNSETGEEGEIDTLQWLSGISSSNQEEFFNLNSPTSHENFPTSLLYSQEKKTIVPSQYQLAQIFEKA